MVRVENTHIYYTLIHLKEDIINIYIYRNTRCEKPSSMTLTILDNNIIKYDIRNINFIFYEKILLKHMEIEYSFANEINSTFNRFMII